MDQPHCKALSVSVYRGLVVIAAALIYIKRLSPQHAPKRDLGLPNFHGLFAFKLQHLLLV